MRWKKSGLLGLLFAVSGLLVSCEAETTSTALNIWNKILWLGRLEFLGYGAEGPLAGFLRILVVILVFAILYELSRMVGLKGNAWIAVTAILAIMSGVLMPGSVLTGIAAAYATAVAFALIGILVLGGAYILWRIPSENRFLIFIKIILIIVLIWILIAIKGHAQELVAVGPMTIG